MRCHPRIRYAHTLRNRRSSAGWRRLTGSGWSASRLGSNGPHRPGTRSSSTVRQGRGGEEEGAARGCRALAGLLPWRDIATHVVSHGHGRAAHYRRDPNALVLMCSCALSSYAQGCTGTLRRPGRRARSPVTRSTRSSTRARRGGWFVAATRRRWDGAYALHGWGLGPGLSWPRYDESDAVAFLQMPRAHTRVHPDSRPLFNTATA